MEKTGAQHDARFDRVCIGKYKIIRQLGRGSEGTVYLAQDEDLNRLVAVKRVCRTKMQQDADRRIEQEADLLKKLGHPMLPVIYEMLWDDTWYLVMEYIQGITLREYIDRNGYAEEEQACAWTAQILDVMEYMHKRKPPVIYRDLKPDNIMVCPDGHLRLVDFGAAVRRHYGEKNGSVMAATPGYAAPEQFGRRKSLQNHELPEETAEEDIRRTICADERSDIYALGKIMYYMVTGADPAKPPYTTLSIRDYQPLLSDRLEQIIRKCIEDDPRRRYQMVEEITKDLEKCGKKGYRLRRRSFVRAVEKRVWLTEGAAFTVEFCGKI